MSAANRQLDSALSLLKIAAGSIGEGGDVTDRAEFSDVGEAVRVAGERIIQWFGTVSDDAEISPAFAALDACTAVGALLDAGMDPRNCKTISPIRGTLTLAIGQLEEFLGGEPEDSPANADEFEEAAA